VLIRAAGLRGMRSTQRMAHPAKSLLSGLE
jgi:hypothetical protein